MLERFFRSVYDRLDIIVLIFSLVISFCVWQYLVQEGRTQSDALIKYENDVKLSLGNLSENIAIYVTGVKGLYESSTEVTNQDFSNYVLAVSENSLSKNLLRVAYVDRVKNEDLEVFSKQIKKSLPDFKINVDLSSPEQYFVTQIANADGKIFDSDGLNLATDLKRKLGIQEAIVSKEMVITTVNSVFGVEGYAGSGLIFTIPVLKDGEVVGLVNALVRLDNVIKDLQGIMGNNAILLSWDGDEKIFVSNIDNSGLKTRELTLNVSKSVNWRIKIGVPIKIDQNVNLVLGLGVIFSFLLYITVYGLASAGVRGKKIAEELTSELIKYKLALDSAYNHIVITDENGVVFYANIAAQKLTGYSFKEIIGQTPRLWGGQMSKDFYKDFWKKIKLEKQVFSGDFNNRRKNGENYIAQSTVSPIIDDGGVLVGFVGVEEDVTEERLLFKQNAESMEKLNKFNQLMVGRELKMVELKKELLALKTKNEA